MNTNTCLQCNIIFQSKNKNKFCSKRCQSQNQVTSITVICKYCNINFIKGLYQIKKSPNHFCSKSCSAKYNNKCYIKRRKKILLCVTCGIETNKEKFSRKKYCSDECNPKMLNYANITIGDIKDKYFPQYWYAHALIRQKSRKIYFSSTSNRECEKCGYSKHIEVCHIKPIKEFPNDTLLKTVNDIGNLIGLCPNCHYELDHNLS